MIHVTSKLLLNGPFLRQLDEATVEALEQTAEALHAEVVQAQVIPRDTGNLQGEAFFLDCSKSSNGKASLVHAAPYARRLYFHPEYNFQTSENPNAKGHWFEDWEPGGTEEDFAPEEFKEIYRRLTGV